MLQDVKLTQLSEMYPHLQQLHQGQLKGGYVPVPMTCVWGYDVKTAQAYHYDVDNLEAITAPEPTTVFSENGDGTVNLRSLQVRSNTCNLFSCPSMFSVFRVLTSAESSAL